ncbi:MAG: hypothetical protein JNJ59_15810 [Deltaproteobacteria bacterium]|nr:hypothetical protein [Deltaproteobacteria bacterium]
MKSLSRWTFAASLIGLVGSAACDKAPAPAATPAAELAAAPAQPAAPAPAPAAPNAAAVHGGAADPIADQGLPPGHPSIAGQAPAGGADLPPGHPPTGGGAAGAIGQGGPMAAAVPAETGVERPLPLEGSGSIAELKARLAKAKDTSKNAILEDAFRKVFTVERAARDTAGAAAALEPLAKDPDTAVASLAERTLGYTRVQSGFDAEGAKQRYARAIELDPDYGEAHYAMAFMLAMGDRTQGKVHFDKAIALGVPDTRGLRGQFYGN